MTLMKDSQEGQLHGVCTVNYCTRNSSCVGSNTSIGSWSMSTYRMYRSISADSYIAAYVGQISPLFGIPLHDIPCILCNCDSSLLQTVD